MSKAFTKDDGEGEAPLIVPSRPPLPKGVPNYVTPRGLAALRDELAALEREGAGLTAAAVAAVAARRAALEARIATAVVVDRGGAGHAPDEVRFGARVTVRDVAGGERGYEIVGVDEADAGAGRIAFVAPLARALLGRSAGDVVTVRAPGGADELEIVAVSYGSTAAVVTTR